MLHHAHPQIEGLPHFHRYLDALPNPALLLDASGVILGTNEQFDELVGLSSDELISKSFFEIHQGCWDTTPLRRLIGDRDTNFVFVSRAQLEVELPNIGRRILDFSHSLMTKSDDALVRLVTIRDVTAFHKLEASLKRSEGRTQALLAAAVDSIVIINTNGVIKAFNPAAERLFGFSAEEVLGLNVRILMPKPYQTEHDGYLARYLETGERRVIGIGREVLGKRKDGATFPMELSISEVIDGEDRLFVGTVRDVTKVKRAQNALRDSEARGRAILNAAVDAIITIDENGLIKSFNQAALKVFGYSHHEMVGENVKMLMPAPFRDEHDNYLQNYKASGIRRVIGLGREAVGRRKDGSTFPMELSVSEVKMGDYRYFTGIVRDITDRKRYEQRLKTVAEEASESELRVKAQAKELTQQAKRLKEAQVDAEQANRAKSDFLANMSHEIRTPLTAILGYASELASTLKDGPEAQAVEIIKRNGEHLLEIMNDILDISKIESGNVELERVPTCPGRIVAEVITLLQVRAKQKGIQLYLTYAGKIPRYIEGSPVHLRQVLLNLIGNAVKFTQEGQVEVRLQFVPHGVNEHHLRFEVLDSGIGIPPEHIGRLFKPFSQADSSVGRCFGGTGLGLAISKRLVELMGGEIFVSSTPDVGSTFTFSIPPGKWSQHEMLTDPKEIESESIPAQPATLDAIDLTGGRILLAEDGKDNQRLLSHYLRKAGAEVEIADNGRIALEAIARSSAQGKSFDLIVTDIQMPEMDGYTLARTLRARGSKLPIVALTAHAMEEARVKCLEAGCSEYTSKPIEKMAFLSICRRWLDQNGQQSIEPMTSESAPIAPVEQTQPPRDAIWSELADNHEFAPVIDSFLQGLAKKINQIEEYMSQARFDELTMLAHQLKGSGGGYGFQEITDAAVRVEQLACHPEDPDSLLDAVEHLQEICQQAINGRKRSPLDPPASNIPGII
ncbi:hypothetical protein C5Y96_10910 [Blastopirellula marina]|uniref:Sensor protein FixL n=1 Tax=Blastopirellula marina TaxID=124 RepID=A0A2S8FND6_9BACT|nr:MULTISPECIES: PAS domain S-box protein [Pirellulaceae]PQO33354.1 hypothetical protein C5Y96_10910 [Blastopirellula marina]RCS52443.1 PAS domain S-box protein [Bremerella cremea]